MPSESQRSCCLTSNPILACPPISLGLSTSGMTRRISGGCQRASGRSWRRLPSGGAPDRLPEIFCFVVMPFRPELNYFFLYLKKYLEDKYKICVERGDSNVLTKELLKKISEQIDEAAFLIADITGSNANVFFELGI